MIIQLPDTFNDSKLIIDKINSAGYDAFFVGGCVRDLILNLPSNDIDIATNAFPEEVKMIFHRTIDVGIEHGTVAVIENGEQYEITTFRTESTYTDFRRPDNVNFVRSLEEDLKRRDFTMNALAISKNGKLIDYYNGLNDLKKKIIKAVGDPSERFQEDALRMMRAFRFSAQLNFNIETQTFNSIKEHISLLEKIAVERIRVEWIKMLLSKNRNSGLKFFLESRAFCFCPRMTNFETVIQQLLLIDSKQFSSESIAWIILFKIANYSNSETSDFLSTWKCSNKMIKQICDCVTALHKVLQNNFSAELVYSLGKSNSYIVSEACYYFDGINRDNQVEKALKELPISSKKDIDISGDEIVILSNRRPGPWVGELLTLIEINILNSTLNNQKSELKKFAQSYIKELSDEGTN